MITNTTREKKLASSARACKSLASKARGLMFARSENLIFEFSRKRRISLHMFFVFYPIDVLFLDEKKKVVDMKERFKPFTFYTSKTDSCYVLELKEGVIEKTGTCIGDMIKIA